MLLDKPQPVETIFIGGGTPTYLSAGQLERLLSTINRWFPIRASGGRQPPGSSLKNQGADAPRSPGEYSIESTPESLTLDKVTVLVDHGVNRVSIGVQSFDPRALSVLERIHSPADVPRRWRSFAGASTTYLST